MNTKENVIAEIMKIAEAHPELLPELKKRAADLLESQVSYRLSQERGSRKVKDVCAAVGITETALSAYESGKRIPRDEVKVKLAAHYGKRVADLFF